MKYTFLLLALFSYFCVSAQSGNNAGSRTTSITRERLVAYGFHYPPSNPVPTDTVSYYYSGENGSDTVDYNFFLSPQVTPPNHQTIKCDSYIYKIASYIRGIYTYNSSGDAVTFRRDDTVGTGTLTFKRFSSWDYAGGLISADSQWSTTSNYKRYHFYDGSGYLVLDSLWDPVALMPIGKTVYTNNAAGLVLTSTGYGWSSVSWVPGSKTINTYDASNRLTNSIRQTYASSTWNNYSDDSFYYALPGTKYYTYTASALWTAGVWVPQQVNTYHINSGNLWDTVYYYSWNISTLSLDTGGKSYITYDAFRNMKTSGDVEFNTSTHAYADTAFELNIYYYETYTSSLGTSTIAFAGTSVNIFPNPVSGTLHVKVEGLASGKKANLSITDVLGQRMISSEITDGDNLMNVSALSTGLYIVTVSGDDVKYTERFVKIE